MDAIILAAGQGSRLRPTSQSINKHLFPVYDKPMIYYPITTALLSGCQRLLLIINPSDLQQYLPIVGVMEKLGVSCELVEQKDVLPGIPSAFKCALNQLKSDRVLCLLGDNIVIGNNFVRQIKDALCQSAKFVGFSKKVADASEFGVVVRDLGGAITDLVEKPDEEISKEALVGIYVLARSTIELIGELKPSSRGETEIVDLMRLCHKRNDFRVHTLDRATVWLDSGSPENLFLAGEYIRVLQARQSEMIACIEEAALAVGLIDKEGLRGYLKGCPATNYYNYVRGLC